MQIGIYIVTKDCLEEKIQLFCGHPGHRALSLFSYQVHQLRTVFPQGEDESNDKLSTRDLCSLMTSSLPGLSQLSTIVSQGTYLDSPTHNSDAIVTDFIY